MKLHNWATFHNIPQAALDDLLALMQLTNTEPTIRNGVPLSEAAVLNDIRLEASQKGLRLFRNNVGAVTTEDGRHIRFGLCNDSKKMNSLIKSSDLIGIRRVDITQDMVGGFIGQFVAREVKAGSWNHSGSEHEEAQSAFIELINSYGGDASFAKAVGTL